MTAVSREKYSISVDFTVECAFVGDTSLDGKPVKVPIQLGDLTVTLSRLPEKPYSTRVELFWEHTDWYSEFTGSEVDTTETSLGACQRDGIIFIPDDAGRYQPFTDRAKSLAGESVYDAARPYFARLSLVSRSPTFWSALRAVDLAHVKAEIFGTMLGHKFPLLARRAFATPTRSMVPVSLATAQSLTATYPRYFNFFLAADRMRAESVGDAVVHLAQGLEVAVYDYARSLGVQQDGPFNPSKVFGNLLQREVKILAVNKRPKLNEYPQVCELFGTRHEWIHMGQKKVRVYDPVADKADRNSLRELTTPEYDQFRSAASKALQFLGEPPIE